MTGNFEKWRAPLCLCLAAFLLAGCNKKEAPKEAPKETAAPATAQARPETAEVVLPLHYDKHTDDLDGMVKRRNIRALVLLNPIGFFYETLTQF